MMLRVTVLMHAVGVYTWPFFAPWHPAGTTFSPAPLLRSAFTGLFVDQCLLLKYVHYAYTQ